jgi:two-component system, cell cycle sensor histidine kinase and response regulator CckA
MPVMNGQQVFTMLNKIQPDLKVIYMSGHPRNIISNHGVLDKGINFIQKPLTIDALTQKVKEVLDMNPVNPPS